MQILCCSVSHHHHRKVFRLSKTTAFIIVTRGSRKQHICPVIRELHWLPVADKINFKLITLYNCLKTDSAPSYLSSLLKSHIPFQLTDNRTKTYSSDLKQEKNMASLVPVCVICALEQSSNTNQACIQSPSFLQGTKGTPFFFHLNCFMYFV